LRERVEDRVGVLGDRRRAVSLRIFDLGDYSLRLGPSALSSRMCLPTSTGSFVALLKEIAICGY